MTETGVMVTGSSATLQRVERTSWIVLVLLAAGTTLLASSSAGLGVLVGGLIANVSFLFLKRDLQGVMAGPLAAARPRFLLKYYARLFVLALFLFILIHYRIVHLFGLLAGLSTVVLSIMSIPLMAGGSMYGNTREA